jgi:hypothetical protein
MSWQRPKFTADGLVNVNHMLGPWEQYDRGSEKWAEAIAAQLQHSMQRTIRDGDPVSVLLVLDEAFKECPHPWTVWPEEAKGNPEAWVRMVTGQSWKDVEHLVRTRKGSDAWEPIAAELARWESKHRTDGAPKGNQNAVCGKTTVGDTYSCPSSPEWDATTAPGIRRRLMKRAKDGDDQAAELIARLTAGQLTVNQAAIAAGMRQQYFRVPLVHDPPRVAAAIAKHFNREEVKALCESLLSITNNDQ